MSGFVVLALGLVSAVAPSAASAGSGDVATTQVLARATNTLVVAALPIVPRALANVHRFASQIAAQCPGVAAESPQNHDSEQLDDEVIGALTTVGYRTAAAPIAAFARAVQGLHWSNPRLTRAAHRFASKLHGLSTLAVPNLCADIGSWVSSGYQTLPASTTEFNRHYSAVDPEAEEAPLIVNLAAPYLTPADVPILHRVERLEAKLGEAEARGVEYYDAMMSKIDLNQ
jgi:hypothetical protein